LNAIDKQRFFAKLLLARGNRRDTGGRAFARDRTQLDRITLGGTRFNSMLKNPAGGSDLY
jgi:hypothetical protein